MIGAARAGLIRNAAGRAADLLLDFANGVYRKDGVTDTFSNLGGTNTGTVSGSGLLCDANGEYASVVYDTSGDFIIVIDATAPPGDAVNRFAFQYFRSSNSHEIDLYRTSGGVLTLLLATNLVQQLTLASFTKIAFGVQGGNIKYSLDGAAVVTTALTITAPNLTGGIFKVGNAGTNVSPWGTNVRSAKDYKGTFIDAEIRAFAA